MHKRKFTKYPIKSARDFQLPDGAFDKGQEWEIQKGQEAGIDVSVYANPKYSWDQMQEIRKGLKSGVDVKWYADPRFSSWQMQQIRNGLEYGVDVSKYADLKYAAIQMEEIRLGLEAGLDIRWYSDVNYDGKQMYQIRKGLQHGVEVDQYADPKYSWEQMEEIRHSLEGFEKPKSIDWDKFQTVQDDEVDPMYTPAETTHGHPKYTRISVMDGERTTDKYYSDDELIKEYQRIADFYIDLEGSAENAAAVHGVAPSHFDIQTVQDVIDFIDNTFEERISGHVTLYDEYMDEIAYGAF